MSKHVSYRGTTIDMESLTRENEKTTAVGNMKVNAKGDQVNRGQITKTADQIARENHRVQSVVVNAGLKGRVPATPETQVLSASSSRATKKASPKQAEPVPTAKETELPNGDIVVDGDDSES